MAEGNGTNGNGVAGALRSIAIFASLVVVQAGLVGATYTVLDQKIDANARERAAVLDAQHADLVGHAARIGALEQQAAANKETVREIETQFRWATEVRELEDRHIREIIHLSDERK